MPYDFSQTANSPAQDGFETYMDGDYKVLLHFEEVDAKWHAHFCVYLPDATSSAPLRYNPNVLCGQAKTDNREMARIWAIDGALQAVATLNERLQN